MARADDDEDRDDDAEEDRKPTSEDKQMAMFAHLGAILLGFIAPLIIWLMYKDKSKFIDRHAKEALNFDITMMIIIVATCMFGAILVGPMALIFHILAGMAANEGRVYRYPMTIRFIK